MYGESIAHRTSRSGAGGLSPRVRGILAAPVPVDARDRSIPACTGNPGLGLVPVGRQGVYPRVYGESAHRRHRLSRSCGLSPRVRGIPGRVGIAGRDQGSIPACTGNPARGAVQGRAGRVYPRVYGESGTQVGRPALREGLSPRVRGILSRRGRAGRRRGSIPACTGNPSRRPHRRRSLRVYPRVYGESPLLGILRVIGKGLSPRVRGIPGLADGTLRHSRSIPACTGNPLGSWSPRIPAGVYPRVYGESRGSSYRIVSTMGLSPRVRGIPYGRRLRRTLWRSIPACTGNPLEGPAQLGSSEVYPRVYGESRRPLGQRRPGHGLSPRVRGIPSASEPQGRYAWSIPACTGNPGCALPGRACYGVYPRVYGESSPPPYTTRATGGLSPRVRGIRLSGRHPRGAQRSIPACTGNPASSSSRNYTGAVYPRVYGESRRWHRWQRGCKGLSPRVRGILFSRPSASRSRWSIPACTGNPHTAASSTSRVRVYPRVYGESVYVAVEGVAGRGLSPRVRGIPGSVLQAPGTRRSIPACTGNPARSPEPRGTATVYPRVYGNPSSDEEGSHIHRVYPRVYGESHGRKPHVPVVDGLSPRVRGIHRLRTDRVAIVGSIPACTGNPPPGA